MAGADAGAGTSATASGVGVGRVPKPHITDSRESSQARALGWHIGRGGGGGEGRVENLDGNGGWAD